MTVAEVAVKKAYLRSGPGPDNAPLMSVAQGARLVIETRQGEWYRVISPQGSRAWIHSSVIAFGGEPGGSPSRTLRIKGYDGSLSSTR